MPRALLLVAGLMALGVAVASCSTTGVKQAPEKADTDASLAYAAIATTVNAYEARAGVTPAQVAGAEALKLKAWEALLIERQTYADAGTVDLTELAALAAQAKALGN
jgi:hypothetical protein